MLTVKELEKLKITDKGRTLNDGNSLYGRVLVDTGGKVEVSFTYRCRFEGAPIKVLIGRWPEKKKKNSPTFAWNATG